MPLEKLVPLLRSQKRRVAMTAFPRWSEPVVEISIEV
jgi:hypothetical protein